TNTLTVNVGVGSTVAFSGNTTALTNIGTGTGNGFVLNGGTLRLDDTGTNVANRLATGSTVFMRSGTLDVLGGSSTPTYTVGTLGNTTATGMTVIGATPGSAGVPTLKFANIPSGANTAFSPRLSTFSVFRFEAGSGVLGTDAVITFAGTPGLGNNGL